MKPLAIELYAGLHGWGEGFVSEGFRSVGYDIVDVCEMIGQPRPEGCELILRDVRSLHGSEFADAAVIVGSSPCQEFSYRAMPWKRAKALPPPYLGIELFQAQFRIQREASEAAGRYIPLIAENVRGAQKFVGRACWHFGSYYLWGDVPALMPITIQLKQPGRNFHFPEKFGIPSPSFHGHDQESAVRQALAIKNNGGSWFDVAHNTTSGKGQNPVNRPIEGTGGSWFTPDEGSREEVGHWKKAGCITRCFNSKSPLRKAAAAKIAKIPFPLAQHIARCFKPVREEAFA